MSKHKPHFFKAILERKIGESTCFLCGCRLGNRNRRDEHVFPKWLQNRYRLWDERLVLLNRTEIPYRKLTVPCCRECNSKHLEPFEKRMSRAVRCGPEAVRALDPHQVFIWIGKIFYGILYRELSLPFDRSQRLNRKIVPKRLLKKYASHHLFLQSARVPMQFVNFFPASILIVATEEPKDDTRKAWDFSDNSPTMSIGCRMGKVGVICVLQDGGAQQKLFFPKLEASFPRQLGPIQFREVMAIVRYKAKLFNRIPKYITGGVNGGPYTVIQNALQRYNHKPLFDPWDPAEYAKVLSAMIRVPIESVFQPPNLVWTWLTDQNRKPVETAI